MHLLHKVEETSIRAKFRYYKIKLKNFLKISHCKWQGYVLNNEGTNINKMK